MNILISEIGSDGETYMFFIIYLCDLHNETELQMVQQGNYLCCLVSFTLILWLLICDSQLLA